jgi:hypothetical protein
MRPGSDLYAKKWVREFWRDQMKRRNAPDLPPNVTVEQFQKFSEQLAEKLS